MSTHDDTTANPTLARSLEELDMTVRTASILQRLDIKTVGQLARFSRRDLENTGEFSTRVLDECEEILASVGLAFRASPTG